MLPEIAYDLADSAAPEVMLTLLSFKSIDIWAIILMGKRELAAMLSLSSWCLVKVEWLFLAVPWGCLRFVIVVFPDHIYLLFFSEEWC